MSSKSRIVAAASVILVAMIFAPPAQAQGHIEGSVSSPATLVSRGTPLPGRSIVTQNRQSALLLNDTAIVLQMTEDGLRALGDKPPTEQSGMGRLVSAVVLAGVKEMFDRGISYPLSSLDHASVDDGALRLVSKSGELVFDSMNINNIKPMHDFDASEAKSFAKKINAAIKRARSREQT